jgi:hypothetical protein
MLIYMDYLILWLYEAPTVFNMASFGNLTRSCSRSTTQVLEEPPAVQSDASVPDNSKDQDDVSGLERVSDYLDLKHTADVSKSRYSGHICNLSSSGPLVETGRLSVNVVRADTGIYPDFIHYLFYSKWT